MISRIEIKSNKFKETELGLIPEDWRILKLGYLCHIKYGKGLPERERKVGNYPVYGSNGVVYWHERPFVSGPGIIIGRKGSIGTVEFTEKDFWPIDTAFFIEPPKQGALDLKFLYYQLKAANLKSLGGTDSAVPGLNRDALASYDLYIPPISEQQKIAGVLGALDEKIELNRKMNKTLESLAQAIFKKWFINDSDPNWETKKLMEVTNIRKGLSYKGKDLVDASENALAGIKCFKRGGGFNPEGLKPFVGEYKAEHLLNSGDLVVAMTDLTQAGEVLGKPALVPSIKEANKIIASLDIVALDPIAEISKEFLYLLLLRQESQDYLWGYSNGSTVLHLSINGLREFPVLVPDKNTLAKFDLIAKPIFRSIQNNENQIINLTQIRDSILPRLMSGKLRVEWK